jgi:TDG/mug DNA glycosylase family protein
MPEASTVPLLSRCFPPLVRADTRVLILGSLPGQASLQLAQYYAHPRNQFWRLLGEITGYPLAELPYAERLTHAQSAGLGLWDVIGQAERVGSLDTALRKVSYNDLRALVSGLPSLRLIAFNGAAAARAQSQLGDFGVNLLRLPSSSPAFTMSYANKLAVWQEIKRYL